MLEFAGLLLVVSAALPISLFIQRNASGIYLTGPLTLAASFLAGLLHVLIDLPILVFWTVLIAVPSASILAIPKFRNRVFETLSGLKQDSANLIRSGMFLIVAAFSTTFVQPPLRWDARSIWFHHASWLNGPAAFFTEAQYLPAGSWPDYPIASPSFMALSWQIFGGSENLWLASRGIAFLVILSSAYVGNLIAAKWGSGKPQFLSFGVFLAALITPTLLADGYFNAGYQDTLQAVLVACLLVAILTLDLDKSTTLAIAVIFVAASNIKQEGFWYAFAALVVGLAVSYSKSRLKLSILLIGISLTARIVWGAFSDFVKMPDNSHTSLVIARLPELLNTGSEYSSKLGEVFSTWVIPRSGPYLLLTLVTVIGFAISSLDKNQKLRFVLASTILPPGILFIVSVTYALGVTHDLQWWLGTSYTRVTATFELLVVVLALISILVLAEPSKLASRTTTPKNKQKSRR